MAAKAPFMEDNAWQSLCLSDPDRALRGLEAAALVGDWSKDYWQQLLWSRTAYVNPETEAKIAELLSRFPNPEFSAIAVAASSWLEVHAKTLSESELWLLWDRIADETLIDSPEANGE